jgi:hypothetical protein
MSDVESMVRSAIFTRFMTHIDLSQWRCVYWLCLPAAYFSALKAGGYRLMSFFS